MADTVCFTYLFYFVNIFLERMEIAAIDNLKQLIEADQALFKKIC